MIKKVLSVCSIVGLWFLVSLIVNNSIILPNPIDVFKRMLVMLQEIDFYQAIFATILRVILSMIISLIIGVILGLMAGLNKTIHELITPIISFLQTIPQIAYILILLVWFENTVSLVLIVALMIIPVFYNNVYNGMISISQDYQDIISLYHQPLIHNILKVYIPLIKGYLVSAIDTTLPLSIKIGVMAEIFVSTSYGIGYQLYYARIQIDMISIFAWTLWMVVIINILLFIYHRTLKSAI